MAVEIIEDVTKLDNFKTDLRENKLKSDYERSEKLISFDTYKLLNENKLKNKQYSGELLEKEILELLKQFYVNKETFIFVNYVFGWNEVDLMIVNKNYMFILEIKNWNCEVINNNEFMELIYDNKKYKLINDNPIKKLNEKSLCIKDYLNISGKIKDYPIYRALYLKCNKLNNINNDYIINNEIELIDILNKIENKRTKQYDINYIITKLNILSYI